MALNYTLYDGVVAGDIRIEDLYTQHQKIIAYKPEGYKEITPLNPDFDNYMRLNKHARLRFGQTEDVHPFLERVRTDEPTGSADAVHTYTVDGNGWLLVGFWGWNGTQASDIRMSILDGNSDYIDSYKQSMDGAMRDDNNGFFPYKAQSDWIVNISFLTYAGGDDIQTALLYRRYL